MFTLTRRFSLVGFLTLLLLTLAAATLWARPAADSAILFIGDGMGPLHITLARQAAGGDPLALERLPFSGLAVTRSAGGKVTDSAAAGTALATGHKTNNGMIGVAPDGRPLKTILEECRDAGKSVGIISTDSLDGATPASFAAHVNSRGNRDEIAEHLARSRAQVMLGYEKSAFAPKAAGGTRTDGKDLVADMRRAGYTVVTTRDELLAAKQIMLLGLFDWDRGPSLAEMVNAALARLDANPKGFFLIVEGARIDWESHDHRTPGMVREVWGLSEAVQAAADYAATRPRTLVVVTADHETGGLSLVRGGRPEMLRNVTNSGIETAAKRLKADTSDVAGVVAECLGIQDLTEAEAKAIAAATDKAAAVAEFVDKRAGVSWSTSGHTATQVKVFALGPESRCFAGDMDNTDIPKRILVVLGLASEAGATG